MKPLAVCTKMGVHLFGSGLKLTGSQPMPVAAFAGPPDMRELPTDRRSSGGDDHCRLDTAR
jgi:hypothetical protein